MALIVGIGYFAANPLWLSPKAGAQLHWEAAKKEQARVRLVALALADPRSSFFSSHEVFIAEREMGREEWSLFKLVYAFLPYQPRLSEWGLDYWTVHEVVVTRDPSCDQTISEMRAARWQQPDRLQLNWRYSSHSPIPDLERRHGRLPCYVTSAEDYGKAVPDSVQP